MICLLFFSQKPNSVFLWLIFFVVLKQAVVVLRMNEQQTGSITQGNGRWHLACQPVTIRPAEARLKHLNKSQNRNTATPAVQKISQLIYLFCSCIFSLCLCPTCALSLTYLRITDLLVGVSQPVVFIQRASHIAQHFLSEHMGLTVLSLSTIASP